MLASRKSRKLSCVFFWKTFDHAEKLHEGLGASMVAENVPKVCEYGCFDEWKFGRVVHSFRKVWTLPKWNCAANWFTRNKWIFVISLHIRAFFLSRLHDYVAIIWTISFGMQLVNGENVCENEKKKMNRIYYVQRRTIVLGFRMVTYRL